MFFPQDQNDNKKQSAVQKSVIIYDNALNNSKPIQLRLTHKKLTYNDIKKLIPHQNLRLFNSDGAQYFQDDLAYIKNKTVLYATKGQDFDSGSCFGEYQMNEVLGQGGFGKVYLAKHKMTLEKFAIKTIKTQNIGSVSDIDAIFVQAQILKSLRHQNIVKVHNCLTLKNMQVAIIMQFLQGGQLLQYVIQRGKLDENTSQNFFKQIVKGMLYCHQNNLIHRDLKLENILLVNSQEQKIKIIDFGIAGAMNLMTWQDLDTGSLGYMAPQCFINSKNYKVDGRIDVWACGIILYGMLHGYLPFKGSNSHETIQLIKQGKYRISKQIQKSLSQACIDVIHKCLTLNPKDRLTMQQLADHPWIMHKMFTGQKTDKKSQQMKQKLKLPTDIIKQEEPSVIIKPKQIKRGGNTKPVQIITTGVKVIGNTVNSAAKHTGGRNSNIIKK